MTKLQDTVNALNNLIISGDTIEAMEIFYSNDIEMQENEGTPRIGKTVCIDMEKLTLERMQILESRLLNQAINPEKQVVFSEWEILVVNKQGNKSLLKEVSVQHWLDGQVAKEKFYYKELVKAD